MPPFRPVRSPVPTVGLTVRPESLSAAGRRLVATAADLRALRGEIGGIAELVARALCAPPGVGSAAVGFTRAWDDAVGSETDVLDHLAGSLVGAAWAYDDVETRLAGVAR